MDTSLNAPLGAHAPFPSQQLVPGCVATPPIADVAPKRGASAARIAALSAQLLAADEAARRHRRAARRPGAELTAARFALANVQTWLPADAPEGCLRAGAGAAGARRRDRRESPADRRARHAGARRGPFGALSSWPTPMRPARACAPASFSGRRAPDAARRASALAVFRVAQEALSNVAKHARATSVDAHRHRRHAPVTDRLRRWDRFRAAAPATVWPACAPAARRSAAA